MRANRFGKLCQLGMLAWSAAMLLWMLNELPGLGDLERIASGEARVGYGLVLLGAVWHLGTFYLLVLFLIFGRAQRSRREDRTRRLQAAGEGAGLAAGAAGLVLFALLGQAVVQARRPPAEAEPSTGNAAPAVSMSNSTSSVLALEAALSPTELELRLDVERVWSEGDHAKALVGVTNRSQRTARYAAVSCAALDEAGDSLGEATWHLGPIGPGARELGAVPVAVRAGALERMRCNLIDSRAEVPLPLPPS